MRAIVLVGGFGTRLRPLTLTLPKQMLPVAHTTMLERVVGGLSEAGVTEVVLSLGYRPDTFVEAYPYGSCAGVTLHYAVEPEPLDTAGAIRFAALEAGLDERFLVVNGDVLTDLDVGALWDHHERCGAEATIALTPVEDPSRFGVVPTRDDHSVIDFVEKPDPGTAPTNYINAGTYVMEPSVIGRIADGRRVSVEREVFPALAGDRTLYALRSDAYWLDAGTPETLLQANLDVLAGKRAFGSDAVHPSARVHPDAVVVDSMIGAESVVEAGARVERSVVFAGSSIGANAEVTMSLIGGTATISEGATVADLSVIGFGEKVEPGAVLSGDVRPVKDAWPD
ncbi:MAG: NDP-sugar synthase [Candidatus Neomicrothrix subdominans]|nr:NDP-sugar synthase [Candidatus Microthrix sp.]MBK6312202.1 NDP-sugar synthase [Candidatus Microthrix sp.]MBK6437159.1 NDP-sugar synthase [Candidatus Microthrix sp.]MBK6969219.1 NDP-sugar synthase [Candidatus Microthrix sp.]MBK9559611.1 NDP-sugar synthase [Candidatus Microthrix sp.]